MRRARFLLAVLAAACGRSPPPGEPFRLVSFREAGAPSVLLNEVLHLTFSAPVDPSSVTARSVAIHAEDGRAAVGRFEVWRDRVEFHPKRVLARSLDDGGYRPSRAFVVEVAGFPRPDGVRSRDGRILERGEAFSFRTVDPSTGVNPFLDESPLLGPFPYLPDSPGPLAVRLDEPIAILFTEPLRPDTVTEEAFALREFRGGPTTSEIPLDARLRGREAANDREEGALVEIRPRREPKPYPTRYVLEIRDRIQDYGGNRVPPSFWTVVDFLAPGPGEADFVFAEDFATTRNLDLEDAGEDGWAAWTGDGRVNVQVPALAGDGRLGPWSPTGLLDWRVGDLRRFPVAGEEVEATVADLPFSEVDLAPEAEVRIAGEGVVGIRSASRFSVRGTIRRGRTAGGIPAIRKEGSPVELGDVLAGMEEGSGPDLVLVSAGNLVVEGEVACEGTLVLVAGGRVVVPPTGVLSAGRIFVSCPGPPLLRGTIHPDVERLHPAQTGEGWTPPRPLLFSCASVFLPFPEGRFLSPPVLEGGGNVEVLFFGARAAVGRAEPDLATVVGPFEDPERLEGFPFLRFRVRLEVRPEAPRAAAFLDAIRIRMRRGSASR